MANAKHHSADVRSSSKAEGARPDIEGQSSEYDSFVLFSQYLSPEDDGVAEIMASSVLQAKRSSHLCADCTMTM
jgi:hypothetical protein